MTPETHAELDRICTEICDRLCYWPVGDKCAGCQTLLDLANLVERLESGR